MSCYILHFISHPACFLLAETPTSMATSQPKTQRIPEGSIAEVTFELSVDGHEVIWFKNDEPLAETSADRLTMHRGGMNQSLIITDTVLDDSATYSVLIDGQMYQVCQLVVEGWSTSLTL